MKSSKSAKLPKPKKVKKAKEPARFGTPEYDKEMRERARWVEAEERREAYSYGMAPWELGNNK